MMLFIIVKQKEFRMQLIFFSLNILILRKVDQLLLVYLTVMHLYAITVYRLCMLSRKRQPDGLNLMEAPSSGAAPNFDLEELKLSEMLDRGR